MKGTNYLRINHDTMCEAMQQYLDSLFVTDGVLRQVKKVEFQDIKQFQHSSVVGSGNGEFIITIESSDSGPDTAQK